MIVVRERATRKTNQRHATVLRRVHEIGAQGARAVDDAVAVLEPLHVRAVQRSRDLPDLHAGCNEPVLLMLAGARDRLFLAEAFGFKVDRRGACPNTPMGGIYAIQPSTGQVSRIAESVEVNRMVVTPDGRDLYVLEPGNPKSHSRTVRLLHIDALGNRERIGVPLPAGDWNLALAHIPAALIPSGRMRSYSNCSR